MVSTCTARPLPDRSIPRKYGGHGTWTTGSNATCTQRNNTAGIAVMGVIDLLLFGVHGITIWAIQML